MIGGRANRNRDGMFTPRNLDNLRRVSPQTIEATAAFLNENQDANEFLRQELIIIRTAYYNMGFLEDAGRRSKDIKTMILIDLSILVSGSLDFVRRKAKAILSLVTDSNIEKALRTGAPISWLVPLKIIGKHEKEEQEEQEEDDWEDIQ